MYIAYDENCNVINALDGGVEKQKFYFCPHCREKLLFKKGIKIQSHFAHKKNSSCSFNSYKRESKEHLEVKKKLYSHFKNKNYDVQLEYIFKTEDSLQIADVYLADKNIAFEYQRSLITTDQLKERTNGYKKAGINLIWLIDLNKFVKELKNYNNVIYIRYAAFVENFLNYHRGCVFFYGYDFNEEELVFYQIWPNSLKSRHAIATKQVCKLEDFELPLSFTFNKKDMTSQVYKVDIENYLYVQLKYDKSVKNKLLSIFYNARITLNNIPQEIGINIREQSLIKTPLLMWQTFIYKMYQEGKSYSEILAYMLNYIKIVDSIYLNNKNKIIKEVVNNYYSRLVK